jgi:predicted acetyltransferase
MELEVRPVLDDELPAFIDTMSGTFLNRLDGVKVAEEVRSYWDLSRTWGAFDHGRMCGTFRSWPTEVTLPGLAYLPASAITGVTVLPTHRRRGTLRTLLAAEHAAIRERGEAVGLLYASDYRIYGRFGYGPACRVAKWTLNPRDTAFVSAPPGGVELVSPDPAAIDTIKPVYEGARATRPGELRRRDIIWEFDLGLRGDAWGPAWRGFLAIRRDRSGTVDGFVRYTAEEKWVDRQAHGILTVDDLHATTQEAQAALWGYLAGIDLVATIHAENRSPSELLPWLLTNARAAIASDVGDGLWVRLFDIPRALEARAYERPAELVLEVIDSEAPRGRIRVRLEAGPEGAVCRPSERSPDLSLDVAALGAAYLGGTRLRDAVLAHGVDEHRDGALSEAEGLFRTLEEPWCSTFF